MKAFYRIGVVLVAVCLSAACVGGWVMEDSPTSEDLYAVWGANGTDVFAVGTNGTVLYRQNSKWRELDSGVEEDLYGVWGTSTEHVVVVGDSQRGIRGGRGTSAGIQRKPAQRRPDLQRPHAGGEQALFRPHIHRGGERFFLA
jgi:hypothetical protein